MIRQPKVVDPFYLSPAWRAIRRQALARDHYRCVICRCSVAGKGQARVDHIKPRKSHPELALVLGNLRTLCTVHDAQAHRERSAGGSPDRVERFVIHGCDANGRPLDPAHPWNRPR